MNPVAMTIINPWKEYWPSQGLNQWPPVLKSPTLPTKLWAWLKELEKNIRKWQCVHIIFYGWSVQDLSIFVDMYVHDIKAGITVSDVEPCIQNQTSATACVNGNNVLGPVVGNFCMKLALQKAEDTGVGWVVASGKFWKFLSFLSECCFLHSYVL